MGGGGLGGGGVSEPCKAGGLTKNPFLFRSLQLPALILLSFPLLSSPAARPGRQLFSLTVNLLQT